MWIRKKAANLQQMQLRVLTLSNLPQNFPKPNFVFLEKHFPTKTQFSDEEKDNIIASYP